MAPRKSLKTHSEFNELNYLLSYVGRCEPQDDLRALDTSRRQPAHGVLVPPSSPTIVYLTLCCEKRVPWLAKERHHEILLEVWQDTSHWVVGRYVLMPDHLHLFAAPQESAVDFDSWVQYFKSQFTKRNKNPSCVWQTGHWDTRIRNMQHYEEKSEYRYQNPVRAGLVTSPDLWKFKGVVHDIRWE